LQRFGLFASAIAGVSFRAARGEQTYSGQNDYTTPALHGLSVGLD
jgi:hypothetical protein